MKVYLGYDEREHEAAAVAAKTLDRVTGRRILPEFLCADKLAAHGLLNRISDHRGGQDFCLVSNAPKSTRFAISRFLTPILCTGGYALFCDSDVVFHRDPREMLLEVNARHAVSVVKHSHLPTERWKMVNQEQTSYGRKNWSSVALYNCSHPSNRRLTLWDVNNRPGRDLHAFYWLHDDEIGSLAPQWNWLVDVESKPPMLGIAHLTLGGPWIPGWGGGSHDAEWIAARDT